VLSRRLRSKNSCLNVPSRRGKKLSRNSRGSARSVCLLCRILIRFLRLLFETLLSSVSRVLLRFERAISRNHICCCHIEVILGNENHPENATFPVQHWFINMKLVHVKIRPTPCSLDLNPNLLLYCLSPQDCRLSNHPTSISIAHKGVRCMNLFHVTCSEGEGRLFLLSSCQFLPSQPWSTYPPSAPTL
jgi:hypothetical protein